MHFKSASSLEEVLEPGEHLIWVDRSSSDQPRCTNTRWIDVIPAEAELITVSFVAVFLGGMIAVSTESFIGQVLGVCLLAVSCVISGILIRKLIRQKNRGENVWLDYMLTPTRLVAVQPNSQVYEQVELKRIISMKRDGHGLTLRAVDPKDEFHLYDLADVDAAEAIIAKTLGPLS